MCIFNQELYVCGHINYTLHAKCPTSSSTPTPTCASLPTTTRFIPSAFIHRTTTLPTTSCNAPTCFYTIESDPFHCAAPAPSRRSLFNPPTAALPSFKTPKRLLAAGPSLYDELLAADPHLSFLQSIQLEASRASSPDSEARARLPLRLSRGVIVDRVYRKYSRLQHHPGAQKAARMSGPEDDETDGLYETPTRSGKRKRVGGGGRVKRRRATLSTVDEEALACGLRALSMGGRSAGGIV